MIYTGSLVKEFPPSTFCPISCIGTKFSSNEHPTWSELHIASEVHFRVGGRGVEKYAMHIGGKKLCMKLLQG